MKNKGELYLRLCDIVGSDADVLFYPDMGKIASFRAGGRAEMLVNIDDELKLMAAIGLLRSSRTAYKVVGKATNILVRDEGYDGVILRLSGKFDRIYPDTKPGHFFAGAMVPLTVMARQFQRLGLTGFEFASGIPGSLGGAIYMNAGAYGSEISDVLGDVSIFMPRAGRIVAVDKEELQFSYRHSIFQEEDYIILGAHILLEAGDRDEIDRKMAEYADMRNLKQPLNYPSAGSFFKRPEGYFAGKLIEDAGLKGLSFGGAQVSEKHAGFIVNRGGAKAKDIIELMRLVQAVVWERFGVALEPEVEII